jgi:hypothetical protein
MNLYIIILALFAIAGLGLTLWGWFSMQQAKRRAQWPTTLATITKSNADSEMFQMMPEIAIRYSVNGKSYESNFELSADEVALDAEQNDRQITTGSQIKIYYNPLKPAQTALDVGRGKADWLVFAVGIATLMFGLLLLLGGTIK